MLDMAPQSFRAARYRECQLVDAAHFFVPNLVSKKP